MERCDLTCMSVLYTKTVNKVLFGQRDGGWVDGQLVGRRSEIAEFKSVVESTFAPHRSSRLLLLRFHLP